MFCFSEIHLAKGLSILFFFSKNQLLVLLIFFIAVLFSFIYLCSSPHFSLLATSFGFRFFFFYSLRGCKVGFFFFVSLFFAFLIDLFIYLFFGCIGSSIAVRGLSLVAASWGYSLLRCEGFSLRWLLLLQSTGSRRAGFSSCGTCAQ